MSEEWINAAEALRVVSEAIGAYQARRAICKRALAGLIRANAVRFLIDGRPIRRTVVPRAFWRAKGEAALEQHWPTGDFSTWINHKIHLQAFGVSFERSGIDELLGPVLREKDRPSHAR